MSNATEFCITSNPDISGIGVRTAIYAQNFITFIPAVYAFRDKRVSSLELESLKTQSTTILITAFAILLSTIVQALASTHSVSNFHAAIILNLSWMNNTNTFTYFLLWLFRETETSVDAKPQSRKSIYDWLNLTIRIWLKLTIRAWSNLIIRVWIHLKRKLRGKSAKPVGDNTGESKVLPDLTMFVGSLHLTLMSAVGIWLWCRPAAFGGIVSSSSCFQEGSVFVVGQRVSFASEGLRVWSLFIYILLLVPGMNLFPPIVLFLSIQLVFDRFGGPKLRENRWWSVIAGLIVLVIIDGILLADTEAALVRAKKASRYLQPGDDSWTFGQTLALLLLLVPSRDIFETFYEERARRMGDELVHHLNKNEPKVALQLLSKGAKANPDALQIAIKNGCLEVVKQLIEEEGMFIPNDTALLWAAGGGHLDIVHYFMAGKTSVDAEGHALLRAAANGHLDVVRDLAKEKPASVFAKDDKDQTALLLAVKNNHEAVVWYLLNETKISIDAKDNEGRTALDVALKNNHLSVVGWLIGPITRRRFGADVVGWLVGQASGAGNLRVLRHVLDGGQTSINPEGYTSLEAVHLAAQAGHLNVVRYLVDEKNVPIIPGVTYTGPSALHIAAEGGHLEVVRYLVGEKQVSVGAQDDSGQTALHSAVCAGKLEVVRYLVEKDPVSVNAKDKNGQTALHLAVRAENPEVVHCLVESKHVSFDAKDNNGNTALHLAALNVDLRIVQCLAEQGQISIDTTDKWGQTALHRAAQVGLLTTVRCLVANHASLNIKDRSGKTALDITCDADVRKYLEEQWLAMAHHEAGRV